MNYLNKSHCRQLINMHGRRAGSDFMWLLNEFIEDKIKQACEVHNGGKQTLDATIAGYIGLKGKK